MVAPVGLKRSESEVVSHPDIVSPMSVLRDVSVRFDRFHSKQWYRGAIDTLLDLADVKPPDKVVDLCCGTGISTEAISRRVPNGQVIGVDNSPQMLELASAKFKGEQGRVTFIEGDALNLAGILGNMNGNVDKVLCCNSVHFFPDLERLLTQVRSALKPGGVFAFNTAYYYGAKAESNWFFGSGVMNVAKIFRLDYPEFSHMPVSGDSRLLQISQEAYAQRLSASGFDIRSSSTDTITINRDDVLEFASIPTAGLGLLPSLSEPTRSNVLLKAAAKTMDDSGQENLRQKWLNVVAVKRE